MFCYRIRLRIKLSKHKIQQAKIDIAKACVFAESIRLSEKGAYNYLIAIDGNSFPSSQKWQLLSGSVLLKNESVYIEWFDRAFKPY